MGGGGAKTPELPATPAPAPVPQAQNVSPQQTEAQRANKISMLKQGIASTIKTSPQGVSGTGADLQQQGPKKALGA